MSEWKARISDDWQRAGINVMWYREIGSLGREVSNGTEGWIDSNGTPGVTPDIEPLRLQEEMGRALLSALLQHFNGADDARMLRKDYDAERARVDRFILHLTRGES